LQDQGVNGRMGSEWILRKLAAGFSAGVENWKPKWHELDYNLDRLPKQMHLVLVSVLVGL
jgi:hypothetical protein